MQAKRVQAKRGIDAIDADRGRFFRIALLALLLAISSPSPGGAGERSLDEMLVKGTHNSFHRRPFFAIHPRHRYEHDPLPVQLSQQGVRALELDLHKSLLGRYLVYHIAVVDDRSHCKAFAECLRQIRRWSDANEGHEPLLVWIEIKDYAGGRRIDSVKPLDSLIRVELGDRLLTPDEVRGSSATLRSALETRGWPSVSRARGKILFMVDGNPQQIADYTSGYHHLRGRVMFAGAEPHQYHMDWAGVTRLNDPAGPQIAAARAARMLVTTTVCVAELSDAECFRFRDLALRSGANVLMDDFVRRVAGRDYFLDIQGTTLAERRSLRRRHTSTPGSAAPSAADL